MRTLSRKIILQLAILFFAGVFLSISPHILQAETRPATPDEVGACTDAKLGAARTKEITNGAALTPAEEFIVTECNRPVTVPPPSAATPPPGTIPPPERLQIDIEKSRGSFVPLTNLPGLTDQTGDRTLADYINVLFRLAIGIGALLAVIKITYAGIKYMSSDAFASKEEAKKDITGALFGLLIMLSTVVILGFIYPGILNINVLQGLTPIKAQVPSSTIPEGVTQVPAKDQLTLPASELGPGESILASRKIPNTVSTQAAKATEADFRINICKQGRVLLRNVYGADSGYELYCIGKAPSADNLPPS